LVLSERTALTKAFVLALLFSLVAGALFVNLATANPAPLFSFPTEPITTLPTIVVHSPIQNQNYNSTNVWLNFTIVKPESWFAIDVGRHTELRETFVNITSIYFTVDGSEYQNIPVHDIDSLFDTDPTFNLTFSTMLPLATSGAHDVKLCLEADSYYVVRYVYNVSEALSNVKLYAESDAVNFTVAQSPQLSTLTESSEPSTMAEPPESDATNSTVTSEPSTVAKSFQTALIVTASAATVTTVGSGLLVYFKKHQQ
jgi:hypothetical protein